MRVVVVMVALLLTACGGDDDVDTSQEAFVDWLSSPSGADLEQPVADCVATRLWPELSEEEVAEFVSLDVEDMSPEEFERAQPDRLDDLTEASLACGALDAP